MVSCYYICVCVRNIILCIMKISDFFFFFFLNFIGNYQDFDFVQLFGCGSRHCSRYRAIDLIVFFMHYEEFYNFELDIL